MSSLALCIPAYNAAWCLPRLLQSAASQAYKFDEIIVYDDCSTDETVAIAEQYGAKIISGVSNVGCSTGKNRIAEIASSEWLHFHDADDDILPNFSEVANKWIKNSESADIVLLNFEYKDFETGEVLGYANFNRKQLLDDQAKFVLTHKLVNFALIRRTPFLNLGGFDLNPKVLYNEDRAFYSKAMLGNLRFDYEHEVTCVNYRFDKSMSASNQLKCAYAYYEVSLNLLSGLNGKYNKELGDNFLENAKMLASFQDWKMVRQNLDLATKLGAKLNQNEKPMFKVLYSINPLFSFWLREKIIRLFKPHLRKNG